MTQDRATDRLIKTGNYFDDVILNMVEVIEYEIKNDTEQKFTELHRRIKIYDTDVVTVPTVPSIAIVFKGWTEKYNTIGKRNVTTEIHCDVDIRYYQEILDKATEYRKTQKALWELSRILRRNGDLNGLSSLGLKISGGEIAARARWNSILAGGLISASVPIVIQSRRAIS